MSLFLLLALPFIGSAIAALLPTNARNIEAWLAGAITVTCTLLLLAQAPAIYSGEIIQATVPWIPALGVNFGIRLDGYAWMFGLIITIMGGLIVLYARYYMSSEDPVPRFFSFLLAFMGSMLGVVVSGNLVQLAVFWELTSLSSFMLIAYWHHRLDARRGARMSLVITGTGGFCLLAGVLLLGHIVGSYQYDDVLNAGATIREHPHYLAVLILIALGALTKSAQFPFHVWLPNAMAAPTPVSAYLHSATMVKAGVFLLARFWPILSGTPEWSWIIGGAGLLSLFVGAYAATFQLDLKGLLAYSTISHLGLITLLLGLNTKVGLVAALFHIMNHATFKASLFMAAGIVDHETGTRDMSRLSGLYKHMPITATLAIVAAASMAGVPLLNGFISKEMFFAETVFVSGGSNWKYLLPAAAVLASVLSVAYSVRFISQVFFGPPAQDLPRTPHEPHRLMLIPSLILVLACLVVGIIPMVTIGPILNVAAASILGANMPTFSLQIWHGINLPLTMSLVAMSGGVTLAWLLGRYYQSQTSNAPLLRRLDGRQFFEQLMERVDSLALGLLGLLFSARLQVQMLWIIMVALVVGAWPLLGQHWLAPTNNTPAHPFFALLWITGGACAIGVAWFAKYKRPHALLMSGGAGLATSLTFAWLSAPDLALTQLTVEVVTIVLILLGLRWLPRPIERTEDRLFASPRIAARRSRDLIIAIGGGLAMAVIAYALLTRNHPGGIASFFIEQALPVGGGANVVNVILVDFRAFDTLGEITVLGIVAISVFALLRRFRPPKETIGTPKPQQNTRQSDKLRGQFAEADPTTIIPEGMMRIPAVLARLLLPIATMISLYFLLRGHNLPGGGFIGGLIFGTALILQYIVGGVVWVEARPRIHPQYWLSAGLLLAGGAAIMVWTVSKPFLTAMTWEPTLPLIGTIQLSSVLLFDLGVYLLVVGASVLMLVALAHQSLRYYRRPAPNQTLKEP